MNNLNALLDAYEAARSTTDSISCLRDGTASVESLYHSARNAEEKSTDAAIKELRTLEPNLTYNTARGMIAMPMYRASLRAQYGVI